MCVYKRVYACERENRRVFVCGADLVVPGLREGDSSRVDACIVSRPRGIGSMLGLQKETGIEREDRVREIVRDKNA